MTQLEFFEYVKLYPNQVNIWYVNTSPPFEIRAISIPVFDKNLQNITNYLVQVDHLSIPLLSGDKLTLEVVDRQLVSTGNTCYYFNVVPVQIPSLISTAESNVDIQLLPAIDQAEFYDSPYNILQGSVEGVRQSSYIMQSDRYKIGTLANPTYTGPLNIQLLLSGSASLANVQDSNYTTTGWIRGRYEGSKTSVQDFKTDPAIGGTVFEGTEFPATVTLSEVKYLQSNNQVISKPYFFAGKGDTPGYTIIPSRYKLSASIDDTIDLIRIIPVDSTQGLQVPQVGNILRVDSELVKINTVSLIPVPIKYTLGVVRGYNSITSSHSVGKELEYTQPVRIYNITGNKLTGIPKGQVLVQQTGVLVKLDSLGYIVSASSTVD